MKKYLSIFLLLTCGLSVTTFAKNGEILSVEKVISLSKDELFDKFQKLKLPSVIMQVNNGIDVYEVIYKSSYPNGTPVTASGILYVPTGIQKAAPIIAYHHGTMLVKDRQIDLNGEQFICAAFAGDGYIVAFPDYFGIGKGEGMHPYQHAESEAQASIDLLRASKEFLTQNSIKFSEQLFITGYSQGGHAAMSTFKTIQEKYGNEFKVTAASPMSGAYDMTGVQAEVMFKPYDHPMYLPYILMGYNQVYEMQHPKELLKAPYDSIVPSLFNGVHDFKFVNSHLPKVPADIFKDEILESYLKDSSNTLRKMLESNNVYDWKPESPMMLCYCTADEQVTYKNALVAYDKMVANGAKNIMKTNSGKKFDHNVCAIYSSIYTKYYFDSFVNGSQTGKRGNGWKRFLIDLSKISVNNKIAKAKRVEKKNSKLAKKADK